MAKPQISIFSCHGSLKQIRHLYTSNMGLPRSHYLFLVPRLVFLRFFGDNPIAGWTMVFPKVCFCYWTANKNKKLAKSLNLQVEKSIKTSNLAWNRSPWELEKRWLAHSTQFLALISNLISILVRNAYFACLRGCKGSQKNRLKNKIDMIS